MKILVRKFTVETFVASKVALLFLIFAAVVVVSGVTHAVSAGGPQNGHLITVHDSGTGTEKVILSKADTIGDALKEAGIKVDSKDLVEPSANQKLVAANYQVNIYRARLMIIVDGNIRQKIITPYQTAQQITASAGITLYPEDITTIDRVDNLIDGAGLQLTIKRATPFEFTLYGNTSTVRTQAKTVGGMLTEKGIKLAKDDRVSPSQDTKLTNGLVVKVWQEGEQTITTNEPVNYSVVTVQDADQLVGYTAVTTPGQNGTQSVTYDVTIQNGQEVSRKEIASLTTEQPVNEVEVIGVKLKDFGGSCSQWMADAGITDTGSASALIGKESGCNPYSVNPSSGACGVGQALPCSKTGCEMGDGACQMLWVNQYVLGKYGSWAAALQHSNLYGWY
ncbi:MAG TPA: ubiquitin-like domain-containing protein [Candidatus Saccharimonadales bacterium]|nr:ubiquitin-like domain-containing protein [Candidatus Saccharimonadales bacterium]